MLGRLNIRQKLALVLWGAALLALVVEGAALVLYRNLTLEGRVRQIMEPYAQLVSVGTEAAVAFEDPVRAQEVLERLRTNPHVLAAQIVLEDGRVLAGFGSRLGSTSWLRSNTPGSIYLSNGNAVWTQSLPGGGRLQLIMTLDQLRQQTLEALWMFGGGVLVLATVTLGQLMVLRRTIIHPVTTLVEATELVRTRGDYGRVHAVGSDEIARLGQSFNTMMEAVRQRERDLRQLTAFQRTILDNAAYGIVSVDSDGIVSSFNPAAEHLLGYTAAEVVGKETPLLWHDAREVAQRAMELSSELGERIAPGFELFEARARRGLSEDEWTFICKDGSRVPVLLSVSIRRDDDGQLTGFVGLFKDLIQRKRTEEELARHRNHLEELVETRTRELALARDAAEAANRSKSDFLARMSHELRTPLNGILGFAQIMQRDASLDPRQLARVGHIRQSGDQLLTLINDILDFAKIEAGKVVVRPCDIPLQDFLRTVAEVVGMRSEQKGLRFTCYAAPDLPDAVRADERLLRQVLLNLLSNAVKFTDSGIVSLRVNFVPPSRLRFEVQDSGVGIAADQLEAIFRPFEQVGETRRQFGGTGLGLAISREFVRCMGGEIRVESRLGEGSRFWFDLEAPPIAAAVELAPQSVVTGYRGPRKTILVVEDLAENRAVITDMLEPLGFELAYAADGREGVERAQALAPDLVLMDTFMPVMDGNEATARLRKTPGFETLPIIAVSASVSVHDREQSLETGASAFLTKPIDEGALLAQIATLLNVELTREAASSQSGARREGGCCSNIRRG